MSFWLTACRQPSIYELAAILFLSGALLWVHADNWSWWRRVHRQWLEDQKKLR